VRCSDGTESGSCPLTGLDISDVEPSRVGILDSFTLRPIYSRCMRLGGRSCDNRSPCHFRELNPGHVADSVLQQ
jgi:hypothetical protein